MMNNSLRRTRTLGACRYRRVTPNFSSPCLFEKKKFQKLYRCLRKCKIYLQHAGFPYLVLNCHHHPCLHAQPQLEPARQIFVSFLPPQPNSTCSASCSLFILARKFLLSSRACLISWACLIKPALSAFSVWTLIPCTLEARASAPKIMVEIFIFLNFDRKVVLNIIKWFRLCSWFVFLCWNWFTVPFQSTITCSVDPCHASAAA